VNHLQKLNVFLLVANCKYFCLMFHELSLVNYSLHFSIELIVTSTCVFQISYPSLRYNDFSFMLRVSDCNECVWHVGKFHHYLRRGKVTETQVCD